MLRGAIAALACAAIVVPLASWMALRPRTVEGRQSHLEIAGERLRAFDAARRVATKFERLATWDRVSGAEPHLVAGVPGSPNAVGLLRGDDAVVVLDASLRELQRVPAPDAPAALAVADDGAVFVAGELAPDIAGFVWRAGVLVPAGRWKLDGIGAVRGIAAGTAGWIYLVEEREGRLVALQLEQRDGVDRILVRSDQRICQGPVRIERVQDWLIVDCILEHGLVIQRLMPSGALSAEAPIRIIHDGPIWSFAAISVPGGLIVAAGGVEDHPLDRTIGAFGYIDSYLFLYRIDETRGTAERQAAVNLSALGVVTPKAIALQTEPTMTVTVSGYGSDKLAHLTFAKGRGEPAVRLVDFVPGTSSVAALPDGGLVFANPLLDAWIAMRGEQTTVIPVGNASRREVSVRLGEALFFTTLMAPYNRSDGPLSRFTCETCHFEGYVDGRTHHTGRDDVHAVTKPLLGLFNNRPHFSRALDPDLTAVAMNEFRVAGAKSDHDPWFSLTPDQAPWLRWIGWTDAVLSPEELRQALMSFLMAFNHRPNPWVVGRARWSDHERVGAELFRDRCESCHASRLVSDEPLSRVPFERWEELVMAREGAIVWGKDEYARTGVVPYVHPQGARVPSLRRLYKKWPYFTNGSAKDLESILVAARFLPGGFWHVLPPEESRDEGQALDQPSRAALISFLHLL